MRFFLKLLRRIANQWFCSYLTNGKQYVYINGFQSNVSDIYAVYHKTVLGSLLFPTYIDDLHIALRHNKVLLYGDDTNLLNVNESPKKLNKYLNLDLKSLTNWLNENRISLNTSKTELVIFKSRRKHLNFDLKLKLNPKRLYPTDSVKYLGVKMLDGKLTCKVHINDIATKLIWANAMLSKIRDYVNHNILKSIKKIFYSKKSAKNNAL